MPDTIPDIALDREDYTDLFTEAGIPIGTAVVIQNKGNKEQWFQTTPTKPAAGNEDGFLVPKYGTAFVDSDALGLWGIGTGDVAVHPQGATISSDPNSGLSQQTLKTAFDETIVAEPTPSIQANGVYGRDPRMRSISSGTGATALVNTDNLFECDSGTDIGGFASTFTNRAVIYRAGQGIESKFTTVYDTPTLGTDQFAGLQNATDIAAFGYTDFEGINTFGILYRHHGQQEIDELTVTAAPAAPENATITVDGTPYIVPLTSTTTSGVAVEIAEFLNAEPALALWEFQAINNIVIARSILARELGNTFAFTSATATATWSNIIGGSDFEREFFPQSEWNVNEADWLNPQGGNVYRIQLQYLGFGGIRFQLKSPYTDKFVTVHIIKTANLAVIPTFSIPHFRFGWAVSNQTVGVNKKIMGASLEAGVEGKKVFTDDGKSKSNTKINIGNTETNILTIGIRSTFGSKVNVSPIVPLLASAFTDSGKGAIVRILIDAELGGNPSFSYFNEEDSIAIFDTTGTTVTGGREIDTLLLGPSGRAIENLSLYNLEVLPGSTITLAARVPAGAASSVTASLTWQEDK